MRIMRIQIILRMRKVSFGYFLSIDAFYSFQYDSVADSEGPNQTAWMPSGDTHLPEDMFSYYAFHVMCL